MQAGKARTIELLKQKVASFETRPALAGLRAADAGGLFATPGGYVHEVFSDGPVDAGAALGFALGQARMLLTPARPCLLILQIRSEIQEMGAPYAPGLARFGLASRNIVLIHAETIVELLWAMEEAIACRAVAAVIADLAYPHREVDFTSSRRLALRAAASGTSVFIVRNAREREASAAKFRWRVVPLVSAAQPYDDRAPGPPRWQVTLEKGELPAQGKAGPEGRTFVVDWTEDGFAPAHNDSTDRTRPAGVATLSRAAPSPLGDRLPQTG